MSLEPKPTESTGAGKCMATLILKHLALEGPQSSMTVIKDTLPGYLMTILVRQLESFYMNPDLMLGFQLSATTCIPCNGGFFLLEASHG